MTGLLLADEFTCIGGPAAIATEGFTLLASDEKGVLLRLDRDFSNNPQAREGVVLYATRAKDRRSVKAIRVASADDRRQRFGRPARLDHLTFTCCDSPCRYLSIYDDGSGRFFDMDVPAEQAAKHKDGDLYHCFFCGQCATTHVIPVDFRPGVEAP